MASPRARRDVPRVQFTARRPHPWRRVLVAFVLAAMAAAGVLAADAAFEDEDARPAEDGASGVGEAGAVDAGSAASPSPEDRADATVAFGTVDDVVLRLPSTETLVVGYHEASRRGALEIVPIGTAASNANTTRFDPPPADADGADYHVMSSRGRVLPPTSAVDLVLDHGDPVLSPVDGVVTQVREYQLYDRHDDTRIEIRPDASPELRVVLIHLDDVTVEVGEQVVAGMTPLAGSANAFPFASHVDRYLDDRFPHVHLEVKDPRLVDDG